MKNNLTVTILGAAGKIGTRISNNLTGKEYHLLYCEKGKISIEKLKNRGYCNTEIHKAMPESDFVIMAVPDTLIERISREIVPLMKKNTTLILLDPAAAYADKVTLRDDCTFIVTHPTHPPLFRKQSSLEAYNDFFGAISASQDIVIALYRGNEENYQNAEKICREMFAPVENVFRMTVNQMILLEPAAAEVVVGSVVYLFKNVIDELVKSGISKDAAMSFMLGHLNVILAITIGVIPTEISDAAKIAIEQNFDMIIQKNWREVFEPEIIKKVVEGMLSPKNK